MNITAVKAILSRKFAGASIDDIQGISDYSLFKEAASNIVNEVSLAETSRHGTLEVFRDVYDYTPMSDLKSLIDERPQTFQRSNNDNATHRYSEEFDQNKANNSDFSLEWIDAAKILRMSKALNGGNNAGLHDMDTLSENGLWTGTASNIALSTYYPYKGSGSISADYDTGEYIENSTFTAVDLSSHKNKSTLFLAAYFPDASVVTNIILRWGSSSANYFSRTQTAPQFGSFRNGWNLIPFAWNGATETGTVDAENVDYLRVALTLSASDTDIRIDNIFSALGEMRDIVYYSKYFFRSTAGIWKEVPTADEDLVNVDTDSENLFVYECIRLAALELQGEGEVYKSYTDELYGTSQKVGMYARYNKRNPDETIQPQTQHRRFGYNKK